MTAPTLDVKVYRPSDRTTPVANLTHSRSRRFQEQLNEAGSGSVILQNDDADLASIQDGDVITFEMDGAAAFSILARDQERVSIAGGEEAEQATTISGPGSLAYLDTALVYPSRGLGVQPVETDRSFGWMSVDYDDSAWGASHAVTTLAAAKASGWPIPFAGKIPSFGGFDVIWAPGTTTTTAPPGHCYFRRQFTAASGSLMIYAAIDNIGELYLDGQMIKQVENFTDATITDPIPVTAGTHTLAVHAANIPGPTINPAGVAIVVYQTNSSGQPIPTSVLVNTESSWKVLGYPANEPGMTVGEILRHVTTEAQARGALSGLTLGFTDIHDTAGNSWPIAGTVTTKVGTDLMSFLRELTDTYIDVAMDPASFELRAWLQDGRGSDTGVALHRPTSPTDPTSGNLGGLKHTVHST